MAAPNVDFLDGYILAFSQHLLATAGRDQSGMYAYYADRVPAGRCLHPYDRHIIRYLTGNPISIVHAGIGLGYLSVALGLAGHRVIGIEQDQLRASSAVKLREWLAEPFPEEIGRYEIIRGAFPEVAPDADLLLFTNVGAGWSQATQDAAISAFPRYRNVLLNLRLFGETRDDEGARDALRQRILATNPADVENIALDGAPYCLMCRYAH